jgi:hypothetical protein
MHVREICKSSYSHIRALRHIRPSLPPDICKNVACSIVASRFDYCNSLLSGTSASNLRLLQLDQNTLARVITGTKCSEHITPVLFNMHWLLVKSRITFKIATMAFKVRTFGQPVYLADRLPPYVPSRQLHSSKLNLITQPAMKTNFATSRSFTSVASRTWNHLPSYVTFSPNPPNLKKAPNDLPL